MGVGLAANAEVPMEFEGETLTIAELASVDMAEKEFAKKVHPLATEADANFEEAFGIDCTDAERKSASRIMDIVSCLHIYFHVLAYSATAFHGSVVGSHRSDLLTIIYSCSIPSLKNSLKQLRSR